jgi:pilus assembly protein FimV
MLRILRRLSCVLCLALPGLAAAVGLGEIHLNSALNEPLSAQIEIVGATPDDLALLRAFVPGREAFEHAGADRAAYLSSISFKVTQTAQGHCVLEVRSSEPFTDPLVTLLVELDWGRGQLVKAFPLLLDPAGSKTSAPIAAATPRT